MDMLGHKLEALERENIILSSQIEELDLSCSDNNLTSTDVSTKDEAESAENVTVMLQEDNIQETDSLVPKEDDVCAEEELKTSEGDKVLQEETCDLEEKLQTEGSECLDTLGPKES